MSNCTMAPNSDGITYRYYIFYLDSRQFHVAWYTENIHYRVTIL